MEANQAINDSSKLIAQGILRLKNFDNDEEIAGIITLLEQALVNLTSSM